MAITADTSDHQNPGACLALNVVISPMMPLARGRDIGMLHRLAVLWPRSPCTIPARITSHRKTKRPTCRVINWCPNQLPIAHHALSVGRRDLPVLSLHLKWWCRSRRGRTHWLVGRAGLHL
jgi:hypothetical protein